MKMLQSDYRIAIVGAGALGSYYGARLVRAGLDVHFLLRSDYDHVLQHGISVSSIDGDFALSSVNAVSDVDEIGAVDLVIVAWKTTANRHYKKTITPLLNEGTKILTLQNGLGNTEELAELFGEQRVYGMLCFIGVNRLSPGVISHISTGASAKIGKYTTQRRELCDQELSVLRELVELLQRSDIPCELEASLERAQWMKLIWNVPFNGLTIAEGGVDTSALLAKQGMENRVRLIMEEVQAVALALDYDISDKMIDNQIKRTKAMPSYRPSSMIDYLEGREVEVDAIWGQPLRRARELNIAVPEIERLHREILLRLDEV